MSSLAITTPRIRPGNRSGGTTSTRGRRASIASRAAREGLHRHSSGYERHLAEQRLEKGPGSCTGFQDHEVVGAPEADVLAFHIPGQHGPELGTDLRAGEEVPLLMGSERTGGEVAPIGIVERQVHEALERDRSTSSDLSGYAFPQTGHHHVSRKASTTPPRGGRLRLRIPPDAPSGAGRVHEPPRLPTPVPPYSRASLLINSRQYPSLGTGTRCPYLGTGVQLSTTRAISPRLGIPAQVGQDAARAVVGRRPRQTRRPRGRLYGEPGRSGRRLPDPRPVLESRGAWDRREGASPGNHRGATRRPGRTHLP